MGSLLLDLVKKGEDMKISEDINRVRNMGFAFLGWSDIHIARPRFASVAKNYGAGYGASVCS